MKSLTMPNRALQTLLQPAADILGLQALPLHAHEIVLAAILYQVIFKFLAPWLSCWLIPNRYRRFTRKEALDWDLQCVSMVQSILISILAIRYLANDDTGASTSPERRVLGYSGAAGSVQALAAGYFLWDLIISVKHFDEVGLPVLIHAISCLIVYFLGFRPIFNYYSSVFLLYELSTPFLNIHLFLNQLGMTGSPAQLINGIALMVVFFCVRLLYGTYSSFLWLKDIWYISHTSTLEIPQNGMFAPTFPVPLWLLAIFVVSNVTLNALNVVWFGLMIKTIRHRAQKGPEKKE